MSRKFQEGDPVQSVSEAISVITSNRPLFHRGKFQSAGWLASWSLNYLISQVKKGNLRHVEKVEDGYQ